MKYYKVEEITAKEFYDNSDYDDNFLTTSEMVDNKMYVGVDDSAVNTFEVDINFF